MYPVLEVLLHLFLVSRVGVDDIRPPEVVLLFGWLPRRWGDDRLGLGLRLGLDGRLGLGLRDRARPAEGGLRLLGRDALRLRLGRPEERTGGLGRGLVGEL